MEKKNLVMVVLCVAIGIMAVAYAAFQTTITVEGTVQATGNFKVEFQEVQGNPCVGTPAGPQMPGATATVEAARINFAAVNLYTPGDVVTCVFPIKNTGNLRARYSSHSTSNSDLIEGGEPISFKVISYPLDLLVNDNAEEVVVEFEYNWNEDTQPTTGLTGGFNVEFYYTQDGSK